MNRDLKFFMVKSKRTRLYLFVVSLVSFILGGCAYHDSQFSYFNMLNSEKGTLRNKKAAEKFWSSVRPVTTLSASHYKLGRYYQKQGKYGKAIEEFSKAIKNDFSFCKAYNGIAMSYDALGSCEMAQGSYEQALQCAPQEAYIYNNYACSRLLCGDYDKGVSLFTKAEQLSSDDKRIKNNLSFAHSIIDEISDLGSMITSEMKLLQRYRLPIKPIENEVVESVSVPIRESSKGSPDEAATVNNNIAADVIGSRDAKLTSKLHYQSGKAAQDFDDHKVVNDSQTLVISISADIKIEPKQEIQSSPKPEKPIVKIAANKTKKIIAPDDEKLMVDSAIDTIEVSDDNIARELTANSEDDIQINRFPEGIATNADRPISRDIDGYKRLVRLSKQGDASQYMVTSYQITRGRSNRSLERNRFGFIRTH